MFADHLLCAAQVADLIGFGTRQTFLRQRDRLEREEDFPPPMPSSRRPLIWRRGAVETWLARSGLARDVPPPPALSDTRRLIEKARA